MQIIVVLLILAASAPHLSIGIRDGDLCIGFLVAVQTEPDPVDCRKFYECRQFEFVSVMCPAELVFNPYTRVCDRPWNVNVGHPHRVGAE